MDAIKEFKCDFCGKKYKEYFSHNKENKVNFCSTACHGKYRTKKLSKWRKSKEYKLMFQRKENGLCVKCGKDLATHKRCSHCSILFHEGKYNAEYKNGLCEFCFNSDKLIKNKCVSCGAKIKNYPIRYRNRGNYCYNCGQFCWDSARWRFLFERKKKTPKSIAKMKWWETNIKERFGRLPDINFDTAVLTSYLKSANL